MYSTVQYIIMLDWFPIDADDTAWSAFNLRNSKIKPNKIQMK